MIEYIIDTRDGDEYIISIEQGFTLKVIPPDEQDENYEYPPFKAVYAIFKEQAARILLLAKLSPEEEMSLAEQLGDDYNTTYDFEGVDISYNGYDMSDCNHDIWLDAIRYYCNQKLDKDVIHIMPYNYEYELNELSCTQATLPFLKHEISFEEYQIEEAKAKNEA